MYVTAKADVDLVNVNVSVDLGDTIKEYTGAIIDELESFYNLFIFKPKTLTDEYKLGWFKDAMDKYSLEEFEEKFPV